MAALGEARAARRRSTSSGAMPMPSSWHNDDQLLVVQPRARIVTIPFPFCGSRP